jgi:hypothetical protein
VRNITKWGLLLALAIILWTAGVHLLGFYTDRIQYAALVDQVVIILPLTLLTLALIEERRRLGGRLPFGRGVLYGTAVAAVSAPLTIAALWYYHHYINPEWVTYLTTYEGQKLTAEGVPLDQIAARIARLQQGATDKSQITGGLVGTLLMGVALSLLITGVLWAAGRLRRPKPPARG